MEKIKQFLISEQGKDILVILVVILVGMGSFQLGRLSQAANSSSGVKVLPAPEGLSPLTNLNASVISATQNLNNTTTVSKTSTTPVANTNVDTHKYFFASNRGKKYYSVGCSAGKTIKLENRVYFASKAAAEAAGYTLSSSCK